MSASRMVVVIVATVISVILLGAILYALFLMPVFRMGGTVVENGSNNNGQGERKIEAKKSVDQLEISLNIPSTRIKLGDQLPLEISIANNGPEARELSFRTSQRFDFWVEDKSGREVWRWSDGQMFAQMLETVSINPNEKISYSAEWKLIDSSGEQIEPGDYFIFAKIVADELREEELKLDITVE